MVDPRPASIAAGHASRARARPMHVGDLPDEVLERVLLRAVCAGGATGPAGGLGERQWLTAGDLARGAPLALVCRRWRGALRALVVRFSFFALPASAAPVRGRPARLLVPLAGCANLRALQLFLRAGEATVFAPLLERFLARSAVHTVQVCFARAAAPAPAAAGAVVLAAAHGAGPHLTALSLDCCDEIAPATVAATAAAAPRLASLALDFSFARDWGALAAFTALTELRLRNCRLDDAALRAATIALPRLETLALGYQGPRLTEQGLHALRGLTRLHTVELARCAGLGDEALIALAEVSSLQSVALLHIDVSPPALVRLARDMGPRLQKLVVSSVRASGAQPRTENQIAGVAAAVKKFCPGLELEFAPAKTPHWSERAYAEALRFVPEPVSPVTVKVTRGRPRRISQFLAALRGRAKFVRARYRRS